MLHKIFRERDAINDYLKASRAAPEIIVASLVLNILSLALPLSLLQVYDRIIPNTSTGTLMLLVFGVLCAVILESILRVARGNIISWIGTKFEHSLGCAAFEHILHADRQAEGGEAVGDTLERLNSLRSSKEYYSGQMIASLIDLPFIFVFLGMVYLLGGPIVWVPIVILTIQGIVSFYYGHQLGEAIKKYNILRDRRLNFQMEILSGIHSIKSMGMEAQMEQRYARLQESVAISEQNMVYRDTSSQHISFIFAQIVMIGVAAYGSTFVVSNDITIGVLAACTLLSGRAMQPFQRLTGLWSRLQTILLARERLSGIFKMPLTEDVPDAKLEIESGAIELKNVSVGFEDQSPLLQGVNLKVAAGECIGISGANGVGKSALLSTMRGKMLPLSGSVSIDDIDVQSYARTALTGYDISFLPQKGEVFNGTILDNLTMFNKRYRAEALELAAGLGLNEVIAKMSKGYDTVIGNSSADALPKGIRQRIAIARALVRKPKIILFDEANASIDGPGDTFLRDYLISLKGSVTMIIITPRPSLLRIADRVYEIKDQNLVSRSMGPVDTQLPPGNKEALSKSKEAPKPKKRKTSKPSVKSKAVGES